MQADLIGSGKEGRKDGKRRTKLHAQWAAERDEKDMAGVVAAMKSGWRRSCRRGLDGEDVRPLTSGTPTPPLLHTSDVDVTTSSHAVLLTSVVCSRATTRATCPWTAAPYGWSCAFSAKLAQGLRPVIGS